MGWPRRTGKRGIAKGVAEVYNEWSIIYFLRAPAPTRASVVNDSSWYFELMGGLRAHRPNSFDHAPQAPLEEFRTRKTAGLLAFCAWHRGWHTREILAEQLWPDVEPRRARNSLRVALSFVREQCAGTESTAGPLEITRAGARLAPAALTDVERFRAHLAQAQTLVQAKDKDEAAYVRALESAVDLVRGPLLPGFYEDWIASASAALEDEFLGALRALMALREARGDWLGALDAARRGAAVAPLREGVMRDIVRLGLACNEDANVRAEFEAWRTRLHRVSGQTKSSGSWDEFKRAHGLSAQNVAGTAGAAAPLSAAQIAPTAPVQTAQLKVESPPFRALPAPAASFVGRRHERATLRAWLGHQATRLVTLCGPGGSGKTRLALEVARELETSGSEADTVFDGVAWAPLAQLPSSRLVAGALLDALGARHSSETIEAVAVAIQGAAATSGRRVLLMIDNCEHLQSGLPQLLGQLLSAAPALVILVTSRSPLQLSGERLFVLRPLGEAPASPKQKCSELATTDAMQLFIERARLVQPSLDVSRASLEAIARVCTHLGGLPLAIEVAAARVALFSPAQMAHDLDRAAQNGAAHSGAEEAGAELAGEAATPLDWPNANCDVPDRHRSLRATIAWSYAQLPPGAALLWRRLSVFRASFSVEAAAAVCPDMPLPSLLLTLRDSSLLALETGITAPGKTPGGQMPGGQAPVDGSPGARAPIGKMPGEGLPGAEAPRGVWLESLRAFAAEQLAPEQAGALRARHAAYFLGWIETLASQLNGPRALSVRAHLQTEAPNLRAMFEWFLQDERDIEGALRACSALWLYWEYSGQTAESHALLEATLEAAARVFPEPAAAQTPDAALQKQLNLRAQCHEGAGKLAYFFADHESAHHHLGLALHLFRRVGNEVGAANCLYSLGFGALKSGDLEGARQLCEQSLDIHRRRRDTQMLGDALYNLSLVALMAGDYDAVRELSQERLILHRASGDRRGVAISLENLGLAALFDGQIEAARAYFVEALSSFEALNEGPSVARALWGLGHVERARGRNAPARAHFERALALARATANTWGYPYLMEAFGALLADAGEGARAARLLAGAATWRQQQGEPLPSPQMRAAFQAQCHSVQGQLGDAVFEAQWTIGEAMSVEALLDLMGEPAAQ